MLHTCCLAFSVATIRPFRPLNIRGCLRTLRNHLSYGRWVNITVIPAGIFCRVFLLFSTCVWVWAYERWWKVNCCDDVWFYRATLCVSAVFAVARCPSVRPSVELSRWIYRQTSFSASSPIMLVFDPQRRYPVPKGTQRGHKIHGVGKFCDFRLKSPFILETVRDRPLVAMRRIDLCRFRPRVTLTRVSRSQCTYLSRISRNWCVLGTKLV